MMAWACRLGYTRRLSSILVLFLICNWNPVRPFDFNCSPVKNCHCTNQGMDEDEWEIQCPKGYPTREVFDITLKVKPLASGNAFLTVICNHEKPEISLELIEGINFKIINGTSSTFNVTEVLVQFCPASTAKNPQVLKKIFSQMNLPLERLTSFVFLPSPKFSTLFSSDLFGEMPLLEILDLQKINLTRIPDISGLTQLKELRLRDNQISVIDPGTFKTIKNLQHLDLSLNNLTTLEEDTLPQSLVHLNLARNNLETISAKILSQLKRLEEFVLTKNPLGKLDPETFNEAKQLRHLQMDSTKFAKFPIFRNLGLREISISYRDDKEDGAGIVDKSDFEVHVTDMRELSKLVLVNDGLTAFPHLENLPSLITLLLSYNQIKVIPEHALKFPLLQHLDLSTNQIVSIGNIAAPNLIKLNLDQNQLEQLTGNMFSKLVKLEELRLSKNKIHGVDPKTFKALSKLTLLDLSNNLITFEEGKAEEEFPEFGSGGFFSEDFDYQSPLRFSTKLVKLDLSYNHIENIFNDWKILFNDLKSLNLSHNHISFLHATTLSFSASDLILDISYNNISTIAMNNAEFIIEDSAKRILRIFIDGNPLNCDCNILAFKTFRLKGIYFKYVNLSCAEPMWLQGIQFRSVPPTDLICPIDLSLGCPAVCDCWNVPANNTIAVDCSYRDIGDSFIPDVHSINGKWAQRYDFTLNLAGNNISDLDAERSKNLSSRILKIDLSENELTSLSFLNLLVNNNISSFYLAANKFSCEDCNFHKMLRSHFKQVPDYNNVSCLLVTESSGEVQTQRYFVDEFPEDQVCVMKFTAELQAMIVAASIFLVFLIIFIAIYFRYGWALRAFLYSKGFGCCFGFYEADDEEGKIYDAFVSYSHKDEDWVLTQLVTRLEEEGFKLCLHFRDWTPGDWIPDQIVRSVDKSRRTIVILSKHFVESVWSRLEFKAAHSQALTDKANRLILIMMDEDLKDQDVKDDDLRVYMKMNTYLKYGDPWFWHKLKYALPHKKNLSVQANFLKQQQRERAIQLDKIRAKMENTISA